MKSEMERFQVRIGARPVVVKCTQDTCRASKGVAVPLEIPQRYCGRRFRLVKNKQTAFGRVWVGSWRTRGDPGSHLTSLRHPSTHSITSKKGSMDRTQTKPKIQRHTQIKTSTTQSSSASSSTISSISALIRKTRR